MNRAQSPDNPLTRAALAMPPATGAVLSTGGRVAGVLLAIYVVTDQSYDRTQIFAAAIAVLALLSLVVAAATNLRAWLMGLGASVVFFAGALFWAQDAGKAMLVVGAIAALGAVLDAHRSGRRIDAAISAFFVGAAVTVAAIAVIVLTVEG